MPISLFRSRTFTGANLLTLWLYAALGGVMFFLPFALIQVHGYSATAAGGTFDGRCLDLDAGSPSTCN